MAEFLTEKLISTLIRLRVARADPEHPVYVVRPRVYYAGAPGLVELGENSANLTWAGWELSGRMIAAADEQFVLWVQERAGKTTPEDAEKRRVA
jgi:hypothetical protein